jgi:hypothetical protein
MKEYRQGLIDLAGSGMNFEGVLKRVQQSMSMIRLVESIGKDVDWLKEFHDFALAEVKKDMARRQNHFDRVKREVSSIGRFQKSVDEAMKACPHCGTKMVITPEHMGKPSEPGSIWGCKKCRFSEYNEESVVEILKGRIKEKEDV